MAKVIVEARLFSMLTEIYHELNGGEGLISPSEKTDKYKISRTYAILISKLGIVKKLGYGRYKWTTTPPTQAMAILLAKTERDHKRDMMIEMRKRKKGKNIDMRGTGPSEVEIDLGWVRIKITPIYKQ